MSGEIYCYFINTWNVEYFKYLRSVVTNCARCTCATTPRIAMAKTAFNKQKALFTRQLGLN